MAVDKDIRDTNDMVYKYGKACRNILISEIRRHDPDFMPEKWAMNNMAYLVGEVLKHDPDFTKDHPKFLEAASWSALNMLSAENYDKSGGLFKATSYAINAVKEGFAPLAEAYSKVIDKAAEAINEKAEAFREEIEEIKWAKDYVFSKDFVDDIKRDMNEAKQNFSEKISTFADDFKETLGYTVEDVRKNMDDFGKDVAPYFQKFAEATTIKGKLQAIYDVSFVDNEASLEMAKHLKDIVAEDKGIVKPAVRNEVSYEPTLKGIFQKGLSEIKASVENYRDAADRLSFEANKATFRFMKEVGASVKETLREAKELTQQKVTEKLKPKSPKHQGYEMA